MREYKEIRIEGMVYPIREVSNGLSKYKEIRIEGMVYRLYEDKTAGIVVTYEDHPSDLVLPKKITYEDEDYILAGIEARLFDLTSIVLPKTIAHLRPKAFTGCAKTLRSITIPGNVKFIGEQAFEDCEALTSVVLEDGVLAIGDMAFSGCKNLTSIKLSNTLLFIGSCAFSNCKSLTTIEMPDTVLFLGGGAFRRCANLQSVTLSHKLTRIESFCLESCGNLISLVIPRSVTNLEDGAFQSRFDEPTNKRLHSIIVEDKNPKYDSRENCNAIIETKTNTLLFGCANTIIPNSVTTIASYAFQDCLGLKSISIPDGVKSIGTMAFVGTGLTSVVIPKSVESISKPFVGLTSIKVEDGNPRYDSRNNCNAVIETKTNELIIGSNSTVIPNDVKEIGSTAFLNCTELKSIDIPYGVTKIKGSAFVCCSGLASIIIPDSVTEKDSHAFAECTGLTYVELPGGITIDAVAFSKCTNLTTVIFRGTPKSVDSSAFKDCFNIKKMVLPANDSVNMK